MSVKAIATYIFIAVLFLSLAGQTYILVIDVIAFTEQWAFIFINYVNDILPVLFALMVGAYILGNDDDHNNPVI